MDKFKTTVIAIVLCVIFAISTLTLAAQKNTSNIKQKELQGTLDNVLTTQYDLKQRAEEAEAKLASQAETMGPLEKKLEEANEVITTLSAEKELLATEKEILVKEKEDLFKEIETLKLKIKKIEQTAPAL